MRVPFLLGQNGRLYPKLYPVSPADECIAIARIAGGPDGRSEAAWFDVVPHLLRQQKKRAASLETQSLQLAKEKMRQFESARAREGASFLPTRTPIADVLTGYIEHIRAIKTAKNTPAMHRR